MFKYGFRLQVTIIVSLILSFIIGGLTLTYGCYLAVRNLSGYLASWYNLDKEQWSPSTYDVTSNFDGMKGNNAFFFHAIIMISAAFVILLYSVVGLMSIWKKMLKVLVLCISVAIFSLLANYLCFAQIYHIDSQLNTNTKDYLVDIMRKSYTEDREQKKYWNSIMIMGECCGVYGPGDFLFKGDDPSNDSVVTELDKVNKMWPLACCKHDSLSHPGRNVDCFFTVNPANVLDRVHTENCYDVLYTLVGVNMFHFVVLILFSVYQLIQITMLMLLYFFVDLIRNKPATLKSTPGSSLASKNTSTVPSRQSSGENLAKAENLVVTKPMIIGFDVNSNVSQSVTSSKCTTTRCTGPP